MALLAVIAGTDRHGEEVAELEHAARREHVLVGADAADVDSCMSMASATMRIVIGFSARTPC
jgi:hypothetical protein